MNVAPGGRSLAVSEAIGWPSGSAAVTLTVRNEFSATATVAGAVTTGARSVLVTVTTVVAEPESALLAVIMMLWLPAWEKSGAKRSVPVVLPGPGVTVVLGASLVVSEAMGWPSGSAAATFTVRSPPSAMVAVAGDVTTGARSVLVTVMAVVPEPVSALLAENVTL